MLSHLYLLVTNKPSILVVNVVKHFRMVYVVEVMKKHKNT
jgi:hypothetical protein